MTYEEYLQRLSRLNPQDYQDPGTQAHLAATAAPLDDLTERTSRVMLARLVLYAPEDALTLLGAERGLTRYPGEYLAAFRNRVFNAWDFWRLAGTVPGILAALAHLGYGLRLGTLQGGAAFGLFQESGGAIVVRQAGGGEIAEDVTSFEVEGETFRLDTLVVPADFTYYAYPPTRVIEHHRDDRAIWAEFSLYLTPTEATYNADPWDDGSRWDDDTLWDLTITAREVERVRAVVNEIKPAHARLRGLYLASHWATDYWDDGLLWDDGTAWDAAQPTPLYLRPGA